MYEQMKSNFQMEQSRVLQQESQVMQKLRELQQENDSLIKKVSESEQRRIKAERDVEHYLKNMSYLKNEKEMLQIDLDTITKELDEKRSEVLHLREKEEDLEQTILAKESELEALQGATVEIAKDVSSVIARVNSWLESHSQFVARDMSKSAVEVNQGLLGDGYSHLEDLNKLLELLEQHQTMPVLQEYLSKSKSDSSLDSKNKSNKQTKSNSSNAFSEIRDQITSTQQQIDKLRHVIANQDKTLEELLPALQEANHSILQLIGYTKSVSENSLSSSKMKRPPTISKTAKPRASEKEIDRNLPAIIDDIYSSLIFKNHAQRVEYYRSRDVTILKYKEKIRELSQLLARITEEVATKLQSKVASVESLHQMLDKYLVNVNSKKS